MIANGFLSAANLAIFHAFNALVGHSWLFDSILASALDNPVVKAGPIGACFLFAWFQSDKRLSDVQRRRILLVTLLAPFLISPITKSMSDSVVAPRPYIMAADTYVYRDGAIQAPDAFEFRELQTGNAHGSIEAARQGQMDSNDLGSFPSDHAALYFALALGIWLASRLAGGLAILWTCLAIFIPRIASGMHWPVDIVAGAAIGALILLALQLVFAFAGRRFTDRAIAWSGERPALVSAVLFMVMIEMVNTLPTLQRAREIAMVVAGRDS